MSSTEAAHPYVLAHVRDGRVHTQKPRRMTTRQAFEENRGFVLCRAPFAYVEAHRIENGIVVRPPERHQ
jgi:hypothetical protein